VGRWQLTSPAQEAFAVRAELVSACSYSRSDCERQLPQANCECLLQTPYAMACCERLLQ
jgi:hypothetical protein